MSTIRDNFEAAKRRYEQDMARGILLATVQRASNSATLGEFIELVLGEGDSSNKAMHELTFGEIRQALVKTVSDKPGPTRKRGVTSGRIVDFVTANPGCSRSDIMEGLGLKGGTTSSQLRMLRNKGLLNAEGTERSLSYFP